MPVFDASDYAHCYRFNHFPDLTGKVRYPKYNTKIKLFNHQKKMYERFYRNAQYCNFSEVGTGKTYPTALIMKYRLLNNNIRNILLVCPMTIMRKWKEELKDFVDIDSEILTGAKQKRIDALNNSQASVFIINYQGANVLKEELEEFEFDMIILDESHHIKNPSTKQTRAVLNLSKTIFFRYILTGTNILNAHLDIYSQLRFVHPDILGSSFEGFKNKYYNSESRGQYTSLSFKQNLLPELRETIYNNAIRFIKDDCLDLPPVTFEKRDIKLTREQQKAYDDMLHKFIVEFSEMEYDSTSAQHILTQLLRLQQISSGWVKRDVGEIKVFAPNPKLNDLMGLLKNELHGEKVVIWAHFKNDMKLIAAAIAGSHEFSDWGLGHFAIINGEVKEKDRHEIIRKFQNESEPKILICQPRAAGEGINMTAAKYSIRYSRSHSLMDYVQSLGRLERIGAEGHANITHIDLVAGGTYDEIIYERLAGKEDMLRGLNADKLKRFIKRLSKSVSAEFVRDSKGESKAGATALNQKPLELMA